MSDLPVILANRTRSAWVGALSAGQEFNWEICKDKSLWGSGANTAGGVHEGDEFFLWQSGKGWFARCMVTSDAMYQNAAERQYTSHHQLAMAGLKTMNASQN